MSEADPDRATFETMVIPLVELDTAELHSFLATSGIAGTEDLRARLEEDPAFLERATDTVRVIYANPKAVEMFGARAPREILGEFRRLWPGGKPSEFRYEVAAILARRPSFSVETRIRRIDGTDIPVVYTSWSRLGNLGSDRQFLILTDISERVRIEEMLGRLRTELAHAGRISILGELSASLAHEVNQPLTAIVTNAQAGLRWLGRAEPELGELKSALETIVVAGRRASDVIARMRAMSQKQELELVALSVSDLVEETLLFLRHELAQHKVSVRLELTKKSAIVLADRMQLQQVLVNLMLNAAQAMSNAHSWRRFLTIRSRSTGGKIRLEVEDTGPGIKPAELARLFDSFYTTKADGMGIGLPICRSIVEAHGGSIDVASRPSLGATFGFELLLMEAGPAA